MAISFPSSPTLNQQYSYNGRTWSWNGTAWQSVGTAQGLQGSTGIQGVQGLLGLQGIQGQSIQGTQGIQGAQGIQGIVGPQSPLNAHQSVEAVQTTPLGNGATYVAGTADAENGTGIGAYIASSTNGALAVDGYTPGINDRLLIVGQANATQNGVYVVTATGSASTTWKITRANDYNNNVAGQVEEGDYVFVTDGTTYGKTVWVQIGNGSNADNSIKIGTDNIQFTQTAGVGAQGLTGAQGAGGVVGYWGSFWDVTNQTAAATNTAYAVNIGNTDSNSLGVSIASNNQITFANSGVYNIQFSFQFQNTDNSVHNAFIWLRKNGVDVAETASDQAIPASHSGTVGSTIAAWNFVEKLNAGDYLQLMWSVDNTSVSIASYNASSPVPSVPGVIVTATQVAYAIQGVQGLQGITGSQGLQGVQGTSIQGITGAQGTQGLQGANAGYLTPTSYISQGRLAADFTVLANTDTLLPFVVDFDPQGWWNPTAKRLTPTVAGYYLIDYQVWWSAGASGSTGQNNIQVRKNGNTFMIDQLTVNSNNGYTLDGNKAVYMNGSTDYIEFTAYTSNTTSQNIQYGGNTNGQGTFFTATLITSGTVQGTTGSQGVQGNAGAQGTAGFVGSNGSQGIQGYTGAQGTAGFVGSNGSQGVQGLQGATGAGVQGIQGPQGTLTLTPARTVTEFPTPTSGQTTFSVSYTPGYIDVFLNGVRLAAADYTATNGTSVVLATGVNSGDVVDVVSYSLGQGIQGLTGIQGTSGAGSMQMWRYTATGGETTLSGTDGFSTTLAYTVNYEQVFVNGVLLERGVDYTATTGTSIVLASAAVVNDIVTVISYSTWSLANAIPLTAYSAQGVLVAGTGANTYASVPQGTKGWTLISDSTQTAGVRWSNDNQIMNIMGAY